jgi:ArsR family transcriptional regulator
MKTDQVREIAGLLRALADETRLRILGLLLTGEVCVCHIHESLGVPQPKASRHLAYLRRAKLVRTRRQGLWIYYRLADPDDKAAATIELAVRHVLGHLPQVRRDARQLEKRNGGCLPSTSELRVLSCCRPESGAP